MKTKFLFTVFLVACGLSVLCLASSAIAAPPLVSQPPPKAVFPEDSYTFPMVVDGDVVKHDFPVKNFGTGELVIEKVKTG